jgi:hypothetical protein
VHRRVFHHEAVRRGEQAVTAGELESGLATAGITVATEAGRQRRPGSPASINKRQ